MDRFIRGIVATCVLLVMSSMAVTPVHADPAHTDDDLIPVIVTFKNTTRIEQYTNPDYAKQIRRAIIRSVQQRFVDRYADEIEQINHTYSVLPSIALAVDATALDTIRADPEVASVTIDRLHAVQLDQSTKVIGAPAAYAVGFKGQGTTVAVLDTGIAKNHPFLSGKVVAEACFSTTNQDEGSISLCPNKVSQSFAVGSAEPCPVTIRGCSHGTHVAGIVAGKKVTTNGITMSGVAPEASLISVQIYSEFAASRCGGSRCAMSFDSDMMAALEWLYANRNTPAWKRLVAVNMSLGGGDAQVACDNEPLKAAIDQLRSVNIATIIASGNGYAKNQISFPACISSAIAVGSSSAQLLGNGMYSEGFSAFTNAPTAANNQPNSNGDRLLDVLAPGEGIYSSYLSNSYAEMSGTSMATPHVAGAWAVIRSALPDATVSQVLNVLYSQGRFLHDDRAGGSVTVPRINIFATLNQMGAIATATATRTRTATATATATRTRTNTRTATATRTRTSTRTVTLTRTPTQTPTQTPTPSPVVQGNYPYPMPIGTATKTYTLTRTNTQIPTLVPATTATAPANPYPYPRP